MKVIFCTSYLTVRDTISLVNSAEIDFVIVTAQESLYKFFVEIYGPSKVKYLSPVPKLHSLSLINSCKYLIDVCRFKRKLLPFFANLKNCDVWFFFVAFCSQESFLIKKLSRNNRVYFKPAVKMKHLKKKFGLKAFCGFLVIRMIYGVWLVPKTDGKTLYFSVDSMFLRSISAIKGNIKITSDCGNDIIKGHFSEYIKNKKILLLVGGVVENGLVRLEEYEKKIDKLIKFLQEQYDLSAICLKAHPGYPERYSMEKTLDEIPRYIPANLIVQFYNIVISYSSAALFEAANGGKTAISLLDYFEPLNNEIAIQYREYLVSNCCTKIYFPQNMDAIGAILALQGIEA